MRFRKSAPFSASQRGFSVLEILLAITFLSVALLFLVNMNTFSGRGTMDVYFESMALSLTYETLEWVSAFSYYDLQKEPVLDEIRKRVGLGGFTPVTDISLSEGGLLTYPEDYYRFERMVQLETKDKTVMVTVRVRLRKEELSLFRREEITLQKLVVADYE